MEDPPTPLIKKRTKSLRPQSSSSSLRSLSFPTAAGADDDEDESPVIVRSSSTRGGKRSALGRVAKEDGRPKSRLSFGGPATAAAEADEEGDDAFQIKKDPISTPRKLLRPTPSSTADQSTTTAARSIYSKEYLDQLKATTLSTPPPPREASGTRGGEEEYDALTMHKFGAQLDDLPSEIPTSAAIASARAKREQRRNAPVVEEGGETFISLDVGFANKGGESRLVREEDEIGDGDEELAEFTGAKETVPLGKKANKEAAERMRGSMKELIADAEEEDAEEEDEEAREWEEAQIRRGGEGVHRTSGDRGEVKKKGVYRAAIIPASTTLPTLASVSTRLSTALQAQKTSHEVDSAALAHFARERAELDEQERELRAEVERVERKNRWFAEFRGFVEELAGFLDDKFPALEKIEQQNLAIQKERFEILSRRRHADASDDVSLFTGLPVPPTFPPVPPLDDTPAPLDPSLAPHSAEREARRLTRAARLAADPTATEETFEDAQLSPADSSDLAHALTTLREDLAALFADVKVDDFRDPNLGIRRRFEEWRSEWGEEYRNAFGGLGLVGVWEFWARVEMALWNPFEIEQLARTPAGLDAYRWHVHLSEFGHHSAPSSADDEGGEDEATVVVNALVASVVLPRLEKFAREAYDPLSARQTTRALGLMDEVSYCVERSSSRFEGLILAFLSRIQLLVVSSQSLVAPYLSSISLPQNAFDPSTFASRTRFATRQLPLLRSALRWRRWAKNLRLPDGVGGAGVTLDELVVRELVAKVVLPVVEAGWATGGEEVAKKVLDAVPAEIVPPALRRRLEGQP